MKFAPRQLFLVMLMGLCLVQPEVKPMWPFGGSGQPVVAAVQPSLAARIAASPLVASMLTSAKNAWFATKYVNNRLWGVQDWAAITGVKRTAITLGVIYASWRLMQFAAEYLGEKHAKVIVEKVQQTKRATKNFITNHGGLLFGLFTINVTTAIMATFLDKMLWAGRVPSRLVSLVGGTDIFSQVTNAVCRTYAAVQMQPLVKKWDGENSTESVLGDAQIVKDLSLADYQGYENLPEELHDSIAAVSADRMIMQKVGGEIPCGVFLFGPPGTGKTFLAKCLAGTFAKGQSSKFYLVKFTDIVKKYVGDSAQNVKNLFTELQSVIKDSNTPVTVFIDEADSLLQKRGHDGASGIASKEHNSVIGVFLEALSGFAAKNTNVFFIIATNLPELVDPALYRDGRLSACAVPYPDEIACQQILRYYLLRKQKSEPPFEIAMCGKTEQEVAAFVAKVLDGSFFKSIDQKLTTDDYEEYVKRSQLSGEIGVQAFTEFNEAKIKSKNLPLLTPAKLAKVVAKARGLYGIDLSNQRIIEANFIPNKYILLAANSVLGYQLSADERRVCGIPESITEVVSSCVPSLNAPLKKGQGPISSLIDRFIVGSRLVASSTAGFSGTQVTSAVAPAASSAGVSVSQAQKLQRSHLNLSRVSDAPPLVQPLRNVARNIAAAGGMPRVSSVRDLSTVLVSDPILVSKGQQRVVAASLV